MAKIGMDSFLLDCRTNDNMAELEAMYGIKGFAIIVRLWQKIYSEKGYYCEWTERSPVLFLANWFGGGSGVDENIIREVVNAAIKIGIFSKEMYDKYRILTSERIQSQYFEVAKRRTEIEVENDYLLLSAVKNWKNVKNVSRNGENVDRISTSKGKESKGNNINILCKNGGTAGNDKSGDKTEAGKLFEYLWSLFPNKKGKAQVTEKTKARLLKIGREEMERAISRYSAELKRDADWRTPQNGSTFFNKGYVDYLDSNYTPGVRPSPAKSGSNRFNNFHQRDTDIDGMESRLLSNGNVKR